MSIAQRKPLYLMLNKHNTTVSPKMLKFLADVFANNMHQLVLFSGDAITDVNTMWQNILTVQYADMPDGWSHDLLRWVDNKDVCITVLRIMENNSYIADCSEIIRVTPKKLDEAREKLLNIFHANLLVLRNYKLQQENAVIDDLLRESDIIS